VGLIGAKITAVVTDDELRKTKPQPVGSKLEAALAPLADLKLSARETPLPSQEQDGEGVDYYPRSHT
jgi:hypothetical protein